MASPDFDVGIIGYGPVGATLANLLGQRGIETVVLEREPSVYHLPRAVALDGEGMRLFQTMGLAGELLPRLNVSRNIRHVSAEGKLLLLIARSGTGPEGWHNAYRFYQPELETVLRNGVSRFPSIDVRLRSDAFALDESRDHVRIRYEDLKSGTLSEVTARYVIGCDGARSTVRRFMGAESARPAFARALDRPRHDSRQAARRRAGGCRRNRPGDRRDPVLRSGAADHIRADARQAPPLGIHADAARRPGDDHAAGVHLRDAQALEHRSGEIEDRARGGLHIPLRAVDAVAARAAPACR